MEAFTPLRDKRRASFRLSANVPPVLSSAPNPAQKSASCGASAHRLPLLQRLAEP